MPVRLASPHSQRVTTLPSVLYIPFCPTVRRRQLATELKRLRLAAKMTIEQVAEHLEWSPGKISKIENARVSVLPRDVRHLLEAYGVGDGSEREALLTLARQSRERG